MGAAGRILGIDIGATSIKYAALDAALNLGERRQKPIAAADNSALLEQICQIIAEPHLSDCDRVGIGAPGPLDLEAGTILASANMPAIRDLMLVPLLQQRFPQKQFRLDNDANAATLGEKFFGAGRNVSDFAVFTLGTGVGGGCVYNGKLQRGYRGNFFEIGHIPLVRDTSARACGCGNRGCLEAYASATGVAWSYEEETGRALNAAEIAVAARGGDAAAQAAFAAAGSALGVAAATVTQLMNITHFIFTGGMAAAEDLLRPAVEQSFHRHTFLLFHPLLKITFTQGDENAGICGAAALYLEV